MDLEFPLKPIRKRNIAKGSCLSGHVGLEFQLAESDMRARWKAPLIVIEVFRSLLKLK